MICCSSEVVSVNVVLLFLDALARWLSSHLQSCLNELPNLQRKQEPKFLQKEGLHTIYVNIVYHIIGQGFYVSHQCRSTRMYLYFDLRALIL